MHLLVFVYTYVLVCKRQVADVKQRHYHGVPLESDEEMDFSMKKCQ